MLNNTCKRTFLLFCLSFLCFFNISNAISVKTYSFDKYGNVEQITDPRGFATQYRYDLLNRLERIEYPDNKWVKYSYDLSGVRTKMEDSHGLTLFEPDGLGQINKVTFPNGESVEYRYDPEGNLTKIIYPDRTEVEYTHDLSNRLKTIKDPSGITEFEYDELSNALKKKTLPNGVTTEYRYYKTRKISNVIHRRADGSLIEEFRYSYDENGNRTKIKKISSEETSKIIYTYDKLNRIKKAEYSGGFFEEFSYDGAGNRHSKTTPQGTTIYEYDEENRLRKVGDTIYEYDFAGNLIGKSSPNNKAIYKYDFDNRLIFYSDKTNQVAFEYDGDGNRISKTVNGTRTDYINDLVSPIHQVLLKREQGGWWKGEKTIRYVYGGSRINQSADGKTQFYLYDSIGRNVSSLISSSGIILNHYEYATFGKPLSKEQEVPNVYKYCGEQLDEETGLIFLRNRYYDPEIGRFITRDPRPGRLDRPSTLNPYCYVENNPVNFVDPWGFEAIEPEELELIGVCTNGWPKCFGGQGWGGHVFLWLPARRDMPYLGSYPEGVQANEAPNINSKTVIAAAWIPSKNVTKAAIQFRKAEWTRTKNCVYHVVEAMKTMEFPHAEKIDLSPIPVPLEMQWQMRRLHERDPVRPVTYPHDPIQSSSKTSPPLSLNFSSNLDFGGVSLSKMAEVQISMADITGATFDPSTGQIILFGPQDRYLPPIDPDDLAVAVKSVYGIGTDPQDPGISIDYSPAHPGQMKVRYDGTTANTAFGQTMLEADYLLKCLVVGINSTTGQPFSPNVPGYSSVLNRLSAHQWAANPSDSVRFWFIPDQITLIETEDHKGMVFSDVRMRVMSEALFRGASTDHPACREFAEHFTTHYDEFAKQLPILEKLKNLGKITAIVKWLRKNNVPFDTSFFANYHPKKVETPGYVTPVNSTYQWTSKQIERHHVPGHRHKRDVEVSYTYTIQVSGGVSYSLNHQNFATYTHSAAHTLTDSALRSRPSENDFGWTFHSPTNRETFIALAQSIYRTKKPGNVKKIYTDMSFVVPGNQTLSLQRFYNSFSEKDSPFGRGWRVLPYELELPIEKVGAVTQAGHEYTTYPMILVRTPEGEDFYQLCMLSDNDLPILKSPINSNFLQDNLNGTFTLVIPHMGHIDFDNDGKLLKIVDVNGFTVNYQFQGPYLTAIYHQDGSAILLEYESDRVIKATGPGNTVMQYTYHENRQLATIGNFSKSFLCYSYDADKRLDKITDPLENVLFEAKYDNQYNLKEVTDGEGGVTYYDYNSLNQLTHITLPNRSCKTIEDDAFERREIWGK